MSTFVITQFVTTLTSNKQWFSRKKTTYL